MVTSMTGFATHTFELGINGQPVAVTIQLKSLNGRFFEVSCKAPFALSHLETSIIKKLRERLVRGTVYCTIFFNKPAVLNGKPRVSIPVVEGYIEAADTIRGQFGKTTSFSGEINIFEILTLPHVVEFPENEVNNTITDRILAELDTVIGTLVQERIREGEALNKDLEKRLSVIEKSLGGIKERSVVVMEQKKEKLLADLRELLAHASLEEKDHSLQLIHSQLDRLDIHEEIVRLGAHLSNARHIIAIEELEKGKRFDFTLQEMSREANTIGAKCSDSEVGKLAISIKVELEKLREQVQNII